MRLHRALPALLTAIAATCFAGPTVDPTLGSGGFLIAPPVTGHQQYALEGLTIDRVGRIIHFTSNDCLVPGGFIGCNFAMMARRDPAGAPDISFLGTGFRPLASVESGYYVATAATVDAYDRIVVAYSFYNRNVNIRRLLDNGHSDLTFGTYISAPPAPEISNTEFFLEDVAEIIDVGVQPDSRPIVAFGSHAPGTPAGETRITLIRLDATGAPDATFGSRGDGIIYLAVPGGTGHDQATGITMLPDGRFVVVSRSRRPDGRLAGVVSRHLPDGSLDPSFGAAGWVIAPVAGADVYARRAALTAEGTLFVAGTLMSPSHGIARAALMRVKADGSPDLRYGRDGWGSVAFRSSFGAVYNVALQPDGMPVVTGYMNTVSGNTTSHVAFALRFNPDTGNADPRYGRGGFFEITTPDWPLSAGTDIAVDAAGNMVVTGTFGEGAGSRWFLTRLIP